MQICCLAMLFCFVVGCKNSETETAGQPEFYSDSGVLPGKLPFSESVRVGRILYVSGQLGTRPGSKELVEGGIRSEAKQALENLVAILKSRGLSTKDVVKCTVMLGDVSDWRTFNEVYTQFFHKPYPVRSAFGTSGLALGAKVEIECIAVFPE